MLSGAMWSAWEIAGTAVFRIVVSSDSIKNATATSHGSNCLLATEGVIEAQAIAGGSSKLMIARNCHEFCHWRRQSSQRHSRIPAVKRKLALVIVGLDKRSQRVL